MKLNTLFSTIAITILASIVLDALVLQGRTYYKIYDRRYSIISLRRFGKAGIAEFIRTTDTSTYAIPPEAMIPLENGDHFIIEKSMLFNRAKTLTISEGDQLFTMNLTLLHTEVFSKVVITISLLSAMIGLVARPLTIRSDIAFSASFFSAVMAAGLLIFYLWQSP
jgi:hypothetical protein